MKKYLASDFKHAVNIRQYNTTTDGAGGTKPTYSNYISTLAKIEPYDGDLFLEGGERVTNNKYIFIFRYRTAFETVNKAYNIQFNSKNYIIHSVINEDQEDEYIRILTYRRD